MEKPKEAQSSLSGADERRRALNMIWNAAGDYSFAPDFMAFGKNKEAVFYLNSIIGFVHKWYDYEQLDCFFHAYDRAAMRDLYDGIVWMGLEHCAYEREKSSRPVLEELRREYSEDFLKQNQWAQENKLLMTLQKARCREFLQELLPEPEGVRGLESYMNAGQLSKWETRLLKALCFDAALSTEEIIEKMRQILWEFFRVRLEPGKQAAEGMAPWRLPAFLHLHGFHAQIVRKGVADWDRAADRAHKNDRDEEKKGENGEDQEIRESGQRRRKKGKRRRFLTELTVEGQDREAFEFIQKNFGKPLYSNLENQRLEKELCTGNHASCHIYFAAGGDFNREAINPDACQKTEKRGNQDIGAHAQYVRNLAYYRENLPFHKAAAAKLAGLLRNSLLLCQEPELLAAKAGTFDGTRAWKAVYLDEGRVFERRLDAGARRFSVDLMLDASASRMGQQEIIASQGYMIAESLSRCGIPAQVYSFLTLEGITVLNLFRGYEEPEKNREIFRYCAGGWNRDGLALRGAGHLMEQAEYENRILLVLTDANPNDMRHLPAPAPLLPGREYTRAAASQDAAAEVRALRKKGIRVLAVLGGQGIDMACARQIYGSDLARIDRMDEFAGAVAKLLLGQLREK